ncbi:MAG: CHASE2 domain-containing serine/threonine-protein kinase [Gallionella sp.]
MNITMLWKKDGFVGGVLALLLLAMSGSDLIQSLERKAYDFGVQHTTREASNKIAVIAIDEESIANLGRWPWSRAIHAKMVDTLAAGHAKVVGYTAFFFEPQVDAGLGYIYKIADLVANSSLQQAPDADKLNALLLEAVSSLNNDEKLSASLAQANNTLLAMFLNPGEPQGNPDSALPDYVQSSALSNVQMVGGANALPHPSNGALLPIAALGSKALAIGHLNSFPDVDGAVRSEALVLSYYDQYYPSLALMLAAKSLNLSASDIQVNLGAGVKVGNLAVATDEKMQMRSFFYADRAGKPAFSVDSFYDVYSGKIPAEKYKDKIVLIGATATGLGTQQVTPTSASMAPVMILAHSLSSLLQGDYFVTPAWASLAEFAVFLLVAAYLILLLPRLKAAMAAGVTATVFVVLLVTHFVLMTTQLLWLQLMLPAVLLLVGHLLLTTKRYLLTEKGKQKSDADSAESNRMLGLAFQGQGQLDMAFDKLRKVPLDNSLMEVLYNLGLDFERKRQFNKAESVFNYMAEFNPKFRDLPQRTSQVRQMADTIVLGGGAGRTNASSLMLGKTGVSKPMLGRYEIEKELGKGAMGVVYFGRDPKIGRTVAIKTVALSEEFEADELQEVKERFFREAETAGRLNHPNIVSIYDAGEEHDLAYIAMEFLKGKDLVPFSKADHLLPLVTVLGIVAKVADALDYAHKQNVVHRDIKPANIMYDPETDTPKVTDFGIARITDSSRTKTGMVLGTPSFMSPEQLAGKKISGSSDLFSLGVMLYQLSTGKLPFEGDSMAQLMYRIANEAPTDILTLKPDLPSCLVEVINKMLQKQIENRYANGAQIAEQLRACAASLNNNH